MDDEHRAVVIAPTYNNQDTLIDILDDIVAQGLDVLVVDDGSSDDTAERLARWQIRHVNRAHVLTHPINRGKAAALMTGFEAATDRGYSHAATIDTDGQHLPSDLPGLIQVSRSNPDALILGTRDRTIAGCPGRSMFGRRSSNMGVFIACGVRINDSQCGLRVYPLRLVRAVPCRASRYGFESEVIIRAVWAGWRVVETPIRCRYFDRDRRVSHYRPWLDSIKLVAMQFRLGLTRMLPWHHVASDLDSHDTKPSTWWRRLWRWLDPARAWRQVQHDDVGRFSFAAGVSVGAFIANLPLWGLQTLLGLYAARRMNLHPVSVVLGTNLSMPPIGPALIALAIGLGHFLLHGSMPDLSNATFSAAGLFELLSLFVLEWLVGSLIVGFACMAAAFPVVLAMLRFVPRNEQPIEAMETEIG